MAGQMVSFQSNGGQAEGYLSVPQSEKAPGVVVIQEWWGLVPHIKDVADRFAGAGYSALAPDIYHGKTTTEPDEAGKLMMSMNIEQAAKDLRGACEYFASKLLQLEALARQPDMEKRIRASTAEFHALKVSQRPTFVLENEIGLKLAAPVPICI